MSLELPTNTKERIEKLKIKRAETTDPLYIALIDDRIKVLYNQLTRESSLVFAELERNRREVENTERRSIKCGLRNPLTGQKPEKDHWFWDTASEKDARELERIKNTVQAKLFIVPEKAFVRKVHILGGLSKALKALKLEMILTLPENVRKEKAKVIFALIEKEMNGN